MMAVFKRENGEWIKKIAFKMTGGNWEQISSVEQGGGSETPTIPSVSTTFGENSWDVISQVSETISSQGMTSEQVSSTYGWNIGDKKSETLSTGEVIELQIIGINHDDKSDGSGKAGLTLQMVNCLNTTYKMRKNKSNAGGWGASVMKTSTLQTIKATLSQELQNVIKLVDKKSANGGGSNYSETITTSDDLFFLSLIEVFASASTGQSANGEGTRYEYYAINNSASACIKKYDKDADGIEETAVIWWLRSCAKSTSAFCTVSTKGINGSSPASTARGVSFAFCV